LICECGTRFFQKDKRQKRCSKCTLVRRRNHDARTAKRAIHDIEFIGVDGEGVNRPDGTHEYVLLSVGNRSLYKSGGERLTFYDIIPFLWDCFLDNPYASYVGFYLGYDFTMWLKDLPENRARMLLDNNQIEKRKRTRSGENHLPFPVEHHGWHFDILGTKRFRLYREGSNHRLYICDTGSFFQTSFLNAIDPQKWPDGPILTETEYKEIALGKSERGQDIVPYGTKMDPDMIRYNTLENEVLARLMTKYNEGLVNVGIRLKRDQWFGPGQAAQTWMKNINVPTRRHFEDRTSLKHRGSLRASYYGGWFEIFAHGHIPGTTWSYDINSAYPHIQSNLPCCLHGSWIQGTSKQIDDFNPDHFNLCYCTIIGSNNYMGGMPHRLRTGHILRPQITKGWYWTDELLAARNAGLIDTIEIEEWIAYIPCDCPAPFRRERILYEDRLRVGKNTIGGKARKLVYNSAYGKTAQSIGTAKYANSFYASRITSGCRKQILIAIATHPLGISDVLMVATDGIVFRNRNNSLTCQSEQLGAWTETTSQNLTLFMPGVYWDDGTRQKLQNGDSPSLKSRGIPARALFTKILEIDELFNDVHNGKGFPVIELPINFSLVSPKQALARRKWWTCGVVDFNATRVINSDPSMKRVPALYIEDGIIRSDCYRTGFGNIESTPYSKTFGDEQLKELDEIITPDGTISMLLPEALS